MSASPLKKRVVNIFQVFAGPKVLSVHIADTRAGGEDRIEKNGFALVALAEKKPHFDLERFSITHPNRFEPGYLSSSI